MDLNPDGLGAKFDFILQVWRPSPTVNVSGCYSLVNDYMSREITVTDSPISERVARITPSPQHQLHFQPGDVLGFYVESHGQGDLPGGDDDNGVVLLNNVYMGYTSESVYFASIDATAQTSQSGSCPYSVGTNGVLNSLTHGAPVISIATTTYSCHQGFSTPVNLVSSFISQSVDPTYSYSSQPFTDVATRILSSNDISM